MNDEMFSREYQEQLIAECLYKLKEKYPKYKKSKELENILSNPIFLLGSLYMAAHFLERSPSYITDPSLRLAIMSMVMNVDVCLRKGD